MIFLLNLTRILKKQLQSTPDSQQGIQSVILGSNWAFKLQLRFSSQKISRQMENPSATSAIRDFCNQLSFAFVSIRFCC
jgi:hypothetical protein